MATLDQLLNDIDEFENWPLDIDNTAADDSAGSVEECASTETDLVDYVLRSKRR